MIQYRKELEQLSPYIPGRPIDDVKREYGLKEVVKLASNENPYGMSANAKAAIIKTAEGGALYPDGSCAELRAALAWKYKVSPLELVFGCGTDEIIAMMGKVFINPGDECITGEYTFSQYAASVLAMGGTMVYAPMKNHGFDLDAILGKITDKTRIIFIANPNNPTGTMHTQAEQAAFMEKVPSNIVVAFDEAYAEYVDDENYPDTVEMMKTYKNIMYLKTFSKAYGLAGMRVGYAIADKDMIAQFEKIRCPFNVPTPAQAAAHAALEDREFIEYTRSNNTLVKDFLCKELEGMGIEYIPSQANFVMADIKMDSRKAFTDLMRAGYIIRAGAAFGMDTFIRISLGTMDEMKGFIKALKELLAQ